MKTNNESKRAIPLCSNCVIEMMRMLSGIWLCDRCGLEYKEPDAPKPVARRNIVNVLDIWD